MHVQLSDGRERVTKKTVPLNKRIQRELQMVYGWERDNCIVCVAFSATFFAGVLVVYNLRTNSTRAKENVLFIAWKFCTAAP